MDKLENKRNRDVFYRTLNEKQKKGELVDLIVGLATKESNDLIKLNIKTILKPYLIENNKVEFFEYIPYITFQTTPQSANSLAMLLFREKFLFSQNKTPLISNADISHIISIPEQHTSFEMKKLVRAYKRLYQKIEVQSEDDSFAPSRKQWNLRNVKRYEAEELYKKLGDSIRVAVIDTGCDYTHPEIREKFTPYNLGYNFWDKNNNPKDGHGHGTHVAGIIGGFQVGVAPFVRLYAVKVLSNEGYGSEADVIKGIEWCIKNGVDIGNMSLGGSSYTKAFQDVCDAALEYGVFLVAAAGNSYIGKSYPAAFESVLSIAAVDKEKRHAEFSNKDNTVDVAAPGVKVLSCIPDGKYAKYSGTSMATPHASGVLAGGLAIYRPERDEDATEDLKHVLKGSCDPCESSGSPIIDSWMYGKGHVNIRKFIEDTNKEYL